MAFGVWVIILPFLGFPGFWEKILMLLTGIIIVVVAYSVRPSIRPTTSSNIPYVEHKNNLATAKTVPAEKAPVPETPAVEIPPSTPVHN